MDEGNIHHSRLLNDSPTPVLLADPTVQRGEFTSLLSRGFKSLLAGSSNREPVETGSLRYLSQIAPQIFSLGYSEAMNLRAQFIPSISRSIASILRTVDDASLRGETELLGVDDSASVTDSPATEWEAQRLTIQRSLWRIAQKQLYKPGSSRNLCLVDPDPGTGHITQPTDDILFSESCSDRTPGGDDDHDSLEYYFGADDEAPGFDRMDDEDSIICMKEDMSDDSDEILCHSEIDDNALEDLAPFVHEDHEISVSMHDMISHLGSDDILQPLSDGFRNESIEDMPCDEIIDVYNIGRSCH
ncbi:hypothetical protein BJX96DRAFT_187135 [Aspergillus floccosus]